MITKQMCLRGMGHQVEGCRLGWELVLGLNLEVGDQMKVRVMVGWGHREVKSSNPLRAEFKWSLFTPVSS